MRDLNPKLFSLSQNSELKIVVTGDIHINSSRFQNFEKERLNYLAKQINKQEPDLIILNGDILDKAKPTLLDLKLFYSFVNKLKGEVFLISGNHEELSIKETCYDYIPAINFTYIPSGFFNFKDWKILLVSHHKLQDIKRYSGDILFSHYRSAVNQHITDEFDNKYVSEKFKYTFLSDIHQKINPYFNIAYTSSPNSLKFKTELDKYGFYSITLGDKISFDYIYLTKYSKCRLIVSEDNIIETKALLQKYPTWLFKLSIPNNISKNIFKDYDNIVGFDFLTTTQNIKEEDYKKAVQDIFNKQNLDPFDVICELLPLEEYNSKVVDDVLIDIKQGLLKD